jgi:hypothetical protein
MGGFRQSDAFLEALRIFVREQFSGARRLKVLLNGAQLPLLNSSAKERFVEQTISEPVSQAIIIDS